jgi:hypothetical protein
MRNKHVCRIWRKSWKGLTLCIHHSDWSPASFSLCCQLFENGYTLWEKFVQLFPTFAIYVGLMGTCLFIPEVVSSIDGYSFRNKKTLSLLDTSWYGAFLGLISHLILVCPTWNEWLLESFKRVSMMGRMDDQSVFLRFQCISQFAVVITNCSDPNW